MNLNEDIKRFSISVFESYRRQDTTKNTLAQIYEVETSILISQVSSHMISNRVVQNNSMNP